MRVLYVCMAACQRRHTSHNYATLENVGVTLGPRRCTELRSAICKNELHRRVQYISQLCWARSL